MLLIASETNCANPSTNDVVREMSFTLSSFATPGKLTDLMQGQSRRIVLLAESDLSGETLTVLSNAIEDTPFGIVVAADRDRLRSTNQAELADTLAGFENVEWIGRKYDYDRLSQAARRCRRRMLRVSEEEIKNALKNGEFVLRYQPKVERKATVDWVTKEAEALVRWHHPSNGLMGPLEFLPEIEAFGLMGELSIYVLREAVEQHVAWNSCGIHLNSCINLASSQLCEATLAETYAEIVQSAGLACSSFTFEVVEQDLADNDAPHIRTLNALRAKGFRICLDDFRIAASSLSTFEALPFDEIKIHASALKRAQNDRVALTVLAAVTGLAHNLGMSVCAEGVEDQMTFEFLKTIECDKMQGFLISEAVIPSIIQREYTAKEEVA